MDLGRFKEFPALIKPIVFFILLIYLITSAIAKPGWWIWLTLIIQLIGITVFLCVISCSTDRHYFLPRHWIIFELIYAGIFCPINLLNTVIQFVELIKYGVTLYGFGSLFTFGMGLAWGLDFAMMFREWQKANASAQVVGPAVRPGDPGNMHPGLGSNPATVPGAFPPPNVSTTASTDTTISASHPFPPAIPPGATFPSTNPPRTT